MTVSQLVRNFSSATKCQNTTQNGNALPQSPCSLQSTTSPFSSVFNVSAVTKFGNKAKSLSTSHLQLLFENYIPR